MLPASIATRVPTGPPRPIRWTVDQFHYLGDLGCFEGRRAMLIDGAIVEEGPMNPPHAIALELTVDVMRTIFIRGWRIRVQMPIAFGQHSDPEPDIAVILGSPRDTVSHPTTASLIVEVSDTSLRYDTHEKMSLYAANGIAEYWVLDVSGRQLIVHRQPQPNAAARFGYDYAMVTTHTPTETVSPLALPTASVRVADLLP